VVVVGGGGGWLCKPILVICLGQADQKEDFHGDPRMYENYQK
jgi:hypothetical protein